MEFQDQLETERLDNGVAESGKYWGVARVELNEVEGIVRVEVEAGVSRSYSGGTLTWRSSAATDLDPLALRRAEFSTGRLAMKVSLSEQRKGFGGGVP